MKKLLKKIIGKLGYSVVDLKKTNHPQMLKPLKIKHFLDIFFSNVDPNNFFFLQIGAHDGKHHDHIHQYVTKYNLHGLALEPQRDVFTELQNTYKNFQNVTCFNVAIGKETGTQPFFSVIGETSLGTFNKEILSDYGDRIRESIVDVITINDLINQFNIKRIDFLQIDCEGYDFEIIKMINFNDFSPKIVNYESVLLSEHDREACEHYLSSLGYKMFRYERDTCAYKV